MHGRYSEKWWEEIAHDENNSSCTKTEILKALNGTLTLTPDTYALMEDPSAFAFSRTVRIGRIYEKRDHLGKIVP
jgi:hypothetical protein